MKVILVLKTLLITLLLSSCVSLNDAASLLGSAGGDPTQSEIVNGLKEALSKGITQGALNLSKQNGYFGNALVKIPFPKEAEVVSSTLSKIGMGSMVDKATLSMNRAAEDASQKAIPIFVNAIKSLSIQDAMGILTGGPNAATNLLKQRTTSELTKEFSPVINSSLKKVDATKYWGDVIGRYNQIPFVKTINPNLNSYVTNLALSGLFKQVASQEQKIRENPAARTSALLQKVFGFAAKQ